jgi:multicomponent Na+:H+ antiporter subunit E
MSTSLWASPWTLPLRTIGFLGWFIGVFVVTTFQVVAFIMTPGRQAQPAIVRLAMDDLTDTEITILVALITITPDTLVIAVDREGGSMFVHGVFGARDPESFRASLQDTHDRLVFGLRARPALSSGQGGGA